jgi:hypothetical protein
MIKSGHEQALKEIGQSYCKTGKETGNDVSAQKWKQEKGEHRWFDERGKNHCDVEPGPPVGMESEKERQKDHGIEHNGDIAAEHRELAHESW